MKGNCLVCLVRHGSTAWNEAGRLQGRRDIPLTARGIDQARRAGLALASSVREHGYPRWNALYTSPLARAHGTAVEIARSLQLEPRVDDDLVERAFGPMEGLTRDDAEKAFPGWRSRPEGIPGLEDEGALRARVFGVLDRLAAAHDGEAIVVVTHGAFINAFLRSIHGADHAGGWALQNGGLSFVMKDAGGWRVIGLNRADHLAGEFPAVTRPGDAGDG